MAIEVEKFWTPEDGAEVRWTFPRGPQGQVIAPDPAPTRFNAKVSRDISTPAGFWARYSGGVPVGVVDNGTFLRAHFAGGDADAITTWVSALMERMGLKGDVVSTTDFAATQKTLKLLEKFPPSFAGFSEDEKNPVHVFYPSHPHGLLKTPFAGRVFFEFNDANAPAGNGPIAEPATPESDETLRLRAALKTTEANRVAAELELAETKRRLDEALKGQAPAGTSPISPISKLPGFFPTTGVPTARVTIPEEIRRTLKELPAWSEIPRGKGRAKRVQALADWALKLEAVP